MCGRFTLRTPPSRWGQLLLPGWDESEINDRAAELQIRPRYNVAPTQSVSCVFREQVGGNRLFVSMRWGLLPPWADDLKIGPRMINARSETVDSKRSFQGPLKKRRCLVPMDGYYEWAKRGKEKQPYLIEKSDGGVLVAAGLFEQNKKLADDSGPLLSVTIITTTANETTGSVHDRMPVFLDEKNHEPWLDPGFSDTNSLKSLLQQAPADLLKLTAVAKTVGNVRVDDESCVEPATSL